MYIISNFNGIDKERKGVSQTRNTLEVIDVKEQIWLPNENYTYCSTISIDIFKKQILLPKKEYSSDHWCEGKNMVYRFKIFEAVT